VRAFLSLYYPISAALWMGECVLPRSYLRVGWLRRLGRGAHKIASSVLHQ
jgi:hypothetical protein